MKGNICRSTSQRDLQVKCSPMRSPQPKPTPLILPPISESLARRSSLNIVPRQPKEFQGLARYSQLRTIGTGAFSRVKLAMDKLTNEAAVIKIISKSWVLRRNQLSHVFAERDILAHLHHPFVVSFKGSFQDRFCLYLVLEYVQGGELYTRIAQTGCIEAYDAKIYACEVFSALSYLHSKQIAYRDLKPENILLTKTGHIKLVDFGLAKIVVDRTFTLCGTPQYLAPEVINAEGHDMQCDWWALGVLLFEMLTGMTPYQADSPSELFQQILTVEVRFESGFPRDARALIEMLLEKDPKKRATKEQIRNSEYFAGVDWTQVSQSRLRPHYRPKVKNPLDASHFDKYSEDFLLEDIKPTEAVLFADF